MSMCARDSTAAVQLGSLESSHRSNIRCSVLSTLICLSSHTDCTLRKWRVSSRYFLALSPVHWRHCHLTLPASTSCCAVNVHDTIGLLLRNVAGIFALVRPVHGETACARNCEYTIFCQYTDYFALQLSSELDRNVAMTKSRRKLNV